MITLDAVQQQDGHVDDVEVRQEVLGAAGHAHGERDQEVTDIVEVTRETPVTGAEEERLVGLAVGGDEGGADDLGGLAPDHALAVSRADDILLVVDGAEDEVAGKADSENDAELNGGQVDGVADKIVRLEGVQPGQPNGITPGEVEAEVVVGDIDGAEVPVLVVEKVQDVGGVEQVQENHRVGDIADLLVLGSGEGQVDHGPGNDSGATVVEELEVKVLAETGVELDTHEKIVDEGTGELAVGGVRGEEVSLDVAEEGEEVSVGVGSDQETTPVVVDNRQLPPAKVETAGSVDSVRDDPCQQSVDLFDDLWSKRRDISYHCTPSG